MVVGLLVLIILPHGFSFFILLCYLCIVPQHFARVDKAGQLRPVLPVRRHVQHLADARHPGPVPPVPVDQIGHIGVARAQKLRQIALLHVQLRQAHLDRAPERRRLPPSRPMLPPCVFRRFLLL